MVTNVHSSSRAIYMYMDFNDKVIFDTVAGPPCEQAIGTAVTVDERYVNN